MVAVFFLFIFAHIIIQSIMKYFKILFVAVLLFSVCTAFSFPFLRTLPKTVFAFGVSASFKDTVVYFTEIQVLDSVQLDKQGFLPNRASYSYQLKNYLEGTKNLPHQTCMIYFSRDKAKLQKQEKKLGNLYAKDKNVTIQVLTASEFQFKKPASEESTTVQ